MQIEEAILTHQPCALSGSQQDSMPARYGLGVQLISMAAFSLAFFGWLN